MPRVIFASILMASAFSLSACNQSTVPAPSSPTTTNSAAIPSGLTERTTPEVAESAVGDQHPVSVPQALTTPESTSSPEGVLSTHPVGADVQAEAFVDALAAGEFDQAVLEFDETMTKVMPPTKLQQTWETLQVQSGKFKKRRAVRMEKIKVKEKDYDVAFVTCEFEKSALDAKIIYTKHGHVTGLFFVPAKPAFVGKEELWLGELTTGGAKLRLLIHLGKDADGKHLAALDSLDQNQKGIPLDVATYDKGVLKLENKALGIVYEGKIDSLKKEISGEWNQGGAAFPITLKQVDSEPQARRPQTPKPPFPYQEIEVAYVNEVGGVKLAGTLTVPGENGPYPAALLITGSGAQDRDETIFNHKPFLVLADGLSRRGIAVLRVDDRGVGGSTKSKMEATIADHADDVRAGIAFLKSRPEVDANRIGLIGHSEGGVIAPLVASQCADVAFVVMLAGSALTGEEILYQQGAAALKAAGASEEVSTAQRELQSRIFAIVKSTSDTGEAVAKINRDVAEFVEGLEETTRAGLGANVKEAAASQAAWVTGNWFRFFLTHDPRLSLEQTRCPVLALNGERDLQVLPKQNLAMISESLTGGGNQDFETHELPGLNHLFQSSRTGQVAEYAQIEETFSPTALKLIGDWILRHVKDASE